MECNIYEILFYILFIVLILLLTKCITVGSFFDFGKWIEYGKEYTDWYDKEYINKTFKSKREDK